MKPQFAALFLTLSFSTFALADNIPAVTRDANFPTSTTNDNTELNKAIEKLNTDVKAWNARCVVTNSEAEQSWCERERAALEVRKVSIKSATVPFATKGPLFPSVDVYLRYATKGKIVKQVTTDSTGHFSLGTFPASVYIMEFRAKRAPGVENQRFAIRVDGIKSKGRADGIPAKYLLGGFGIDVETAPGTPIAGQITTGSLAKTKKMVWVPQDTGSHFPAHWVEEGSSLHIARNGVSHYSIETVQKIMDHVDQP
jgi:hypothetical protein